MCPVPTAHSEAVTRERGAPGCLLTALAAPFLGGLHADCRFWHPNSSSFLGIVTLGKAFSKRALHPCPCVHFPGRQQAGASFAPLPLAPRILPHLLEQLFGAGAATVLHGDVPGTATRAH